MFLHGGESSLVTEQGDYNIHRMVPRYVKYYLNWTRDTFPSIVRLSWTSLMLLFVSIKLITIAIFAAIMKTMDGSHQTECVTGATSFMDFFYFVVHTIFTIGYGSMSPVCHWSNMMVTVISFFGMFQTATFTGIFFAKFSMDPRRNYACAFTTKLVGIPPMAVDAESADEMVKLNFRFVNVFHRRYFKVSCKLYLIEHRVNRVTEQWLSPTVEELKFFDTSTPLEFMSLPVEVCFYVPFSRLVRQQSVAASPLFSPASTPRAASPHIHGLDDRCLRHRHRHQWIRHFSGLSDKDAYDDEHARPRVQCSTRDAEIAIDSEFEVMCMLVFTDATTGCEMAVRKSWALADSIWLAQSEPGVRWKNVIHRDDQSDKYLVDVTGLDFIENSAETVIPLMEDQSPGGSMSPANQAIAYRLINTMTMPARTHTVGRRTGATDLFPSPIPEESNV